MPQKAQKRGGVKRVQQACNNCAKGKCRCDGETPCSTCASKGLDNCEYTLVSTPAKRRRADSTASTAAAANALSQMASSAHASPKDWLQDFNGHHNDISMQPPVVYGFTPTFNGVMGGDPYMYNNSKPGSRYASRAASPSHAFEAPFESGLPAASNFGFLFKDSARDLPTIGSILPSYIAPPNMADYPHAAYNHNGIDQPGGYSNYRNDYPVASKSLQNNNSISRPSSPLITSLPEVFMPDSLQDLEDKPLAEVFTDQDRKHLQEYTRMQMPATRVLNILIQLYFEKFHMCLPIIHRPNFSAGKSNWGLTLVIMALGCRYLETAEELQRPLFTLAQQVLKLEQDTFTALQAHFLLDVAELYNVQSQGSMEAVEERRIALIRNARNRKLFDESYDDAPGLHASTEMRWQMTQHAEERRRLSWAIWLYDHLFKVFFNARALLDVDEVSTSLPCHENLWEANTAKDWANQFAPDPMPLRTRTLLGAGRLEESVSEECRQYGSFCRTILAHVEARRVQDIADQTLLTDIDVRRGIRRDADSPLDIAADAAAKTFDVLQDVLNSESAMLDTEMLDGSLNLHFARLTTSIDLRAVRQYLSGDDRAIRAWAENSVEQARSAALSAAHLMRLLGDRQATPFAGMVGFYSTMILFCFAKYHSSNDSSQQHLQLDTFEFGSVQARQWIENGAFIPTVCDIGLLLGTNIPRIITSWDRAGIAYWGLETLKQRIESLVQFE